MLEPHKFLFRNFILIGFFLLSFVGLVEAGDTPVSAVSQKTLVGALKNPDVVEGCGCYFQTPPESRKRNSRLFIFMSDVDDIAYMNIDGKDVKLKPVGPSPLSEKAKKGERSTRHYSADSIKVRMDSVISWVCPPKDESCEVTKYDATFTVEKGGQKEIVQTKGDCGC